MLTAHRSSTRRAVFAAVIAVALPSGTASADDDPTPEPAPVTCSGKECIVTAQRPGQTSIPAKGAGGPQGSSPRPVVPNEASPGSSSLDELSFAERYWAYGEWPVYVTSPNGPMFPVPFPADPAPVPPAPVPVAVVPPSPAEVAQVAVSRLRLPSPVVGTSPAGDQVVRVPTWLWVDRSVWGPVSATASVPGVSVTATAVPVSATWSMGDGESVTCPGPGTAYGSGSDPASASPDCGYTYARSSAGVPGERFSVWVTVAWRVSWSGGGQSGTVEGLSTRAGADVRVREVQAVVVNPVS